MTKKELKKYAVKIKGGCCVLCGYSKCLAALHFHHFDSFLKKIQISSCSTLEELEEELDKCVILCSNCHAEVHQGLVSIEYLIELNEKVTL